MSFRYDKDNLFKEFQVATTKDSKGKKEKYDNRIQFFTDHIELRKQHPEYTGAAQKRFAWYLGLIMAGSMVFIVNMTILFVGIDMFWIDVHRFFVHQF